MLIEEPRAITMDPILAVVSSVNGGSNERIREGVYEIGHFGGSHYMPGYEHWVSDLSVPGYGVCDSADQLLAKCPELEQDGDRQFVVTTHTLRKSEEPSTGGWRWHKWGEYIGEHEPTQEYLAHEPVIEEVVVYHIYEKND